MTNTQNYAKINKAFKTRNTIIKTIVYVVLVIWALFVLFPFYWMILSSIKSNSDYMGELVPKFFTMKPTFENYVTAFTEVKLARYFLNTVIYAVVTTAIMLVVTIFAAFAFSRLEFKGRDLVFTIFLSMMMIPNELVIITNFVTITNLDMRNSFPGLILPSIASIFYIYLLKENFAQIPDELYYAAKVDGANDFKYLWKVMVPIVKPTIVSIIILKVIECWNNFAWPRLITDSENYAHLLVSNGIQEIRENGLGRDNIPAMMAAVVVVSLPLIALFLIFKKQIMTGVSKSGTKG